VRAMMVVTSEFDFNVMMKLEKGQMKIQRWTISTVAEDITGS
jgi:hypothetical protein